MTIQFKKLNENATMPSYATRGAAGMDLSASEKFTILPNGGTFTVSTGLSVELPEGLEMQIRPRSGLAAKFGITVLNSPCTIDEDFRGEIKILLINHGPYNKTFQIGDRIAQAVISKVEKPIIILAQELSSTERGEGGFGSTGL
jgi:dUTP pyrophosphatase